MCIRDRTNDVLNPREKMIKEEGDKYWENRKGEFTKEKMKNYRDGKYREEMCIRDRVYVGIGGQSLRTVRNVVSSDLEEEAIISEELVNAIGDENVAIPVVDMDKMCIRDRY